MGEYTPSLPLVVQAACLGGRGRERGTRKSREA